MSGVKSPVSSTTLFFKCFILGTQSINLYLAKDFNGAMYTQLPSGSLANILKIANYDMIVLPDPVGAPIKTFLSVWYKVWNSWVCIGLKKLNLGYKDSNN